ncbi:MAG: hypothetical protein AB7O48_16210 [Cyclobacteriaceae bacterium]
MRRLSEGGTTACLPEQSEGMEESLITSYRFFAALRKAKNLNSGSSLR